MKKTLTFIPLAIGIGALFLYIYNIICFKVISDTTLLSNYLYTIRIYLIVAIIAFIVYFMIKLIEVLSQRKVVVKEKIVYKEKEPVIDSNDEIVKEQVRLLSEEKVVEKEVIKEELIYCNSCGALISKGDTYCHSCGRTQTIFRRKRSLLRIIINIIEIIIMLLLIYFLIVNLFDYKEKTDPNFESPFKTTWTK